MRKDEELIKKMIATYLRLNYKGLVFRFDIGADIHLPTGLAVKSKRIHQHERGYPDLFIAKTKEGYGGLFLEIKTDEMQVFKKTGQFRKRPHITEQNEMIKRLNESGYLALYSFGFDDTKNKIDNYLSGRFFELEKEVNKLVSQIPDKSQF